MTMNKKILYLMILVCYGLSMQVVNAQVTQVNKVMAQYEDAFFSKIESISEDYNNDISNLIRFILKLYKNICRLCKVVVHFMR